MNEELRLLEANRLFYQALSDLDIEAMEAIWIHEPWVSCIHPGWPPLHGWPDVLESWQDIFANTIRQRVEPTEVSVRVFGEVGWVSCEEHITIPTETGETIYVAVVNNVFVLTDNGWKIILHHSSPLPVEMDEEPPPPQVH
jgi:ketosteroid isomerase-like protein